MMEFILINTAGFVEQDMSGRCPECNYEMEWDCVLGPGDYPQGGFRNRMKPNTLLGLGYECPKCETASIHHASEQYIIDVLQWQQWQQDKFLGVAPRFSTGVR